MAEEIKAILTADSSELQAEFNKARKVAEDYHQKLQEMGAKTVQTEIAMQRALRLEAAGHTEAAGSLRQKLQLEENALTLAKRSGIAEETAMKLVQRRAALEQKLAAVKAGERQAERAAQAAQAQAQAEQLAREQAITQAYIKEKLAKQEAALVDKANAGKQTQLRELTPEYLKNLDKVRLIQNDLARSSTKLQKYSRGGGGGGNAGMGLMILGQAVDDVQYGFQGVLNNIPSLVTSFGGSTGLAGAIGIAAVAAYQLYKGLKYISGVEGVEKFDKAYEAAAKSAAATRRATLEQLQRSRELQEVQRKGRIEKEKELAAIEKAFNIEQLRWEAEERAKQRRQTINADVNSLQGARGGLAESKARNLPSWATDLDQRTADVKVATLKLSDLQQNERQQDIQGQKEILDLQKRRNEQIQIGNKAQDEGRMIRGRYGSDISSATRELDRLQERAAWVQEQIDVSEKTLESEKSRGDEPMRRNQQQTLDSARATLAEYNRQIDQQQEKKARMEELDQEAARAQKEAFKTASDRALQLQNEEEALRQSMKQRHEMAKVTKEQLDMDLQRAQAEQGVAKNKAIYEANQAGNEDAYKEQLERKARRDWLNDQGKEIASERALARARMASARARNAKQREDALYQNAVANALKKELAMRAEAHALAERTKLTEKQALDVIRARERARVVAKRAPRSGSKIGGDAPGSGLRRTHVQAGHGLLTSEEARRQRERKMMPKQYQREDKAAKVAERLLANSDAGLDILKKIGLY